MRVAVALVIVSGWWACMIDAKLKIRAAWDNYDDPDDESFAAYVADRKRSGQ